MGLWHWIASKVTADAPPANGRSAPASATTAVVESATATVDRPAPAAKPAPAGEVPWWVPAETPVLELPALSRPELTTEARALENLLLLNFDGRNLELPNLPHVPEGVLRMLGKSQFSMADIAAKIRSDQVATAAVLRASNSPLYRGMVPVTAIEPAVVRLGTNAIRTLMLNLSMRSVMFRERRKGNNFAELLWVRAFAAANIMRELSRFTHTDPEESFLLGLLHDVGNIIVLRIVNQQHSSTGLNIDEATFEYLCFETHQEFGELIADNWSLPDNVKALICDHHSYPVENHPLRVQRLQLQLADMICSLLDYAPHVPYYLTESRPARDLNLSDNLEFLRFLPELPDLVAAAIEPV